MSNKLTKPGGKTIITTGKGKEKAVVSTKPKISTQGKIRGFGNEVDIVFVFDTTGSMDDKIEALLLTCRQFVDEAEKLDLDTNYALISFGDVSVQGGGDSIDLVVPLTNKIEQIKNGLENIPRNNGFGNWGESCLEAVQKAFSIKHRKNAVKVMIVVTDEPALQHNISVSKVISDLKKKEYLVFVVAINEQYYKDMARENGGSWSEIRSNTSLEEILKLFRNMAKKVSKVAQEVHLIGQGSISKYLALKDPTKDKD